MAARHGKKQAPKANAGRRMLVGMGAGAGVILAAAAMATGSAVTAAPAHADFEDLLDPIIQPLLTSLTDSLSAVDPAAALDLTSWTDSLLASFNSIDLALPSTDSALAAASSGAEPAASAVTGTYDLPITVLDSPATEPTVNASIDGGTSLPVLVDTGSSGLVVPLSDVGSGNELSDLLSLGFPTSFGESGYSGGVDYIYLTYNDVPVTYAGGLTTDGPVEVEVYSWNPSDFTSFFSNDAFQSFLASNDTPGGVLGIGDNVGSSAGESPFQAAGFGGVTVDLQGSNPELIVSGTPDTAGTPLTASGSTVSGLTEKVTDGSTLIGSGAVSDDLDTGGVFGTIPSSIAGSSDLEGDTVTVYDGSTPLYSYVVAGGEAPSVTSGTTIDSGFIPLDGHLLSIDYNNGDLYYQ